MDKLQRIIDGLDDLMTGAGTLTFDELQEKHESLMARLKKELSKLDGSDDNKFIKHIEGHLTGEQKVVCKICGKTAAEIIKGV